MQMFMSLFASALSFTQRSDMCDSQLCRLFDLIGPRTCLWVILLMLVDVGKSSPLNAGRAPCMWPSWPERPGCMKMLTDPKLA